jgi:uncharacterized protein (TIGR02588 family)
MSARPDRAASPRTSAEWVTLGVSVAIVLAVVGALTWLYLTGASGAPVIEVEPLMADIRQERDAWYLPVVVRNSGGDTAEDVRVTLSLTTAEGDTEEAELTVAFLAGQSSARGVVAFRSDPSQGDLSVDVISYLQP